MHVLYIILLGIDFLYFFLVYAVHNGGAFGFIDFVINFYKEIRVICEIVSFFNEYEILLYKP